MVVSGKKVLNGATTTAGTFKGNIMNDKQQAMQKIADLKDQIQQLLWEAEGIADEAGVYFNFNPTGAYGAGASYTGANAVDEWERSEYDVEEGNGFWCASSQSC